MNANAEQHPEETPATDAEAAATSEDAEAATGRPDLPEEQNLEERLARLLGGTTVNASDE